MRNTSSLPFAFEKVTVTKDADSIHPFPLGERDSTFDAVARLPSGDLLVSAGIGFERAPTGSIAAADDAIVLVLRAQDGVWTEAERKVVSATPLEIAWSTYRSSVARSTCLGILNGR